MTRTNRKQKRRLHAARRRARIERTRRHERGRRAADARAHEQRRFPSAAPSPTTSAPHVAATTYSDETMVAVSVDPEDIPLYQAYLIAHGLLPPFYPTTAADVRRRAPKAYRTLESAQASAPDLLEAILLLGHTPTSRALNALRGYARSGRQYARIARIAAQECETLPRLPGLS